MVMLNREDAQQSLAPERKGRAEKLVAISSGLVAARTLRPVKRGVSALTRSHRTVFNHNITNLLKEIAATIKITIHDVYTPVIINS